MEIFTKLFQLEISFHKVIFWEIKEQIDKYLLPVLIILLTVLSLYFFNHYYFNGLGLAYNDARSHLDIGRRVVEGLKPGAAQLGSVWLPLPHILMIPFIWNDFMWHTGLAGAINSMIAFVITGVLINQILKKMKVGLLGRIFGVVLFSINLNILYLQSTAMTELLLIATTTASVYYLISWGEDNKVINLIKCAFWVMMSTLNRYDGWFLFALITGLISVEVFIGNGRLRAIFSKEMLIRNYKKIEGILILFCTLGGFGIFLWFMWNLLIFGDPLFFAFGPYSAHAQQDQLESAGNLITKGNLWISIVTYFYALFFNLNTYLALFGFFGSALFWFDKKISLKTKIGSMALFAPLLFNIIALFFGHSVLFVQGINGNTWFNIRYGVMLVPTIAIFSGFLIDRLASLRVVLIGLFIFVSYFSIISYDAVTIDDARVGSSQKNVSEVSGYLANNAANKNGFVLISAASHDAIIFSSGLPMSRFIHEGTGEYWKSATTSPDRWARWIVTRTYDDNDSTWKLIKNSDGLSKYRLVANYPFADVYELREEFLDNLTTDTVYKGQK